MARLGAERFWSLLQTEDYVHALGAISGNQAVQQVAAGLKAIYLSGWQVGTGYFDAVAQTISGGTSSTAALKGSTEEEQFDEPHTPAVVSSTKPRAAVS